MSLERPWLDNYPSGVPATIDVGEYPSIVAVLDRATADYRDRPAFDGFVFHHYLGYRRFVGEALPGAD